MQQIRDRLTDIIQNIIKKTNIFTDEENYDSSFSQLGIDSLDTMSIFLAVQEEFELDEIPEDKIVKLTTANLIASYIKEELEKKGSDKQIAG